MLGNCPHFPLIVQAVAFPSRSDPWGRMKGCCGNQMMFTCPGWSSFFLSSRPPWVASDATVFSCRLMGSMGITQLLTLRETLLLGCCDGSLSGAVEQTPALKVIDFLERLNFFLRCTCIHRGQLHCKSLPRCHSHLGLPSIPSAPQKRNEMAMFQHYTGCDGKGTHLSKREFL